MTRPLIAVASVLFALGQASLTAAQHLVAPNPAFYRAKRSPFEVRAILVRLATGGTGNTQPVHRASHEASLPGSQAMEQADIQLQALDLAAAGEVVTIRVVVSTDNSGAARNAVLHVLLPIGAKVARVPSGCRPSASPNGANNARVDCDLGDMRVRDLRELTIVTTALPGTPRRFGAFVFSDTPDPQPSNNSAARTLP